MLFSRNASHKLWTQLGEDRFLLFDFVGLALEFYSHCQQLPVRRLPADRADTRRTPRLLGLLA
jgi:hypothetical protein